MSCKRWKEAKEDKAIYLNGFDNKYGRDGIVYFYPYDYCPFCGSKLDENGCTGGEEDGHSQHNLSTKSNTG